MISIILLLFFPFLGDECSSIRIRHIGKQDRDIPTINISNCSIPCPRWEKCHVVESLDYRKFSKYLSDSLAISDSTKKTDLIFGVFEIKVMSSKDTISYIIEDRNRLLEFLNIAKQHFGSEKYRTLNLRLTSIGETFQVKAFQE
jgi:hypothetical protein